MITEPGRLCLYLRRRRRLSLRSRARVAQRIHREPDVSQTQTLPLTSATHSLSPSGIPVDMRRAAKDGDVETLKKLLDAGAHVNMLLDSYDLTALHYASWHGRTAAAFELIQVQCVCACVFVLMCAFVHCLCAALNHRLIRESARARG